MGQKIIFVSGKGGVGKSTLAAAIALSAAQAGHKTLLAELGDHSYFELAWKLAPVGYRPQNVGPNLDLALWSSQECLKEYALHLLKVESLYKLFFENPVMRSLINVAPALKELAILGKITSQPRKHGPSMEYDVLVVDAFATGHFLALLAAPAGMAQAIQFGPMGEQSRGIDQVIRDPEICQYVLVTLPEELPIQETRELKQALKTKFGIEAQIILNKSLSFETSELESLNPKKSASANGENNFMAMLSHHAERSKVARENLESAGEKNYLTADWVLKNSAREISDAIQLKLKKNFAKYFGATKDTP